ncbi:MAG: transglutaminase domain-containing protein [Gammaproteobacteria bacterium]|jgi:hypothetical protein|nr:transglutaminase domain-containing protein [Gammaproteobacteria bacterium]MCP4881309.1 transglutaminase domain-containing protein [Gammaproteobacteria bacterium]MDP6166998.1 transglutaminase-like domain-containing protein [Gammaproteobacteria bacterium]
MVRLNVKVNSRPRESDAILLWPKPPAGIGWQCQQITSLGLSVAQEIQADNASLWAQWAKAEDQQAISLCYEFEPLLKPVMADDYWHLQENRHTQASGALVEQVSTWVDESEKPSQQLYTLIHKTADMFAYGHVEQRFTEGKSQVPPLCGITNGSCVDINTFLIAAARSLGIKVQYLAGYWFHPSRSHTHDMHCWLDFEVETGHEYWDVAHHLKWDVEGLHAGLNPAGGRRWLMSYGRGLTFQTIHGEVSISHFSEPLWVYSDGSVMAPQLHIELIEY